MNAGVGLVVRSKRTIGPVAGEDGPPDDDEEQAAERATRSERRGRRMPSL